ncbi:hypothetical protein EJ08DRAFT_674396 [Tothia fuscella]|uniref:Uncharacterized protein n=1 Tax=Tothia fuscella TaxID=1048955 RepID=A0A9P4P3B4_9PEZI|nr:hypothetical protein EJ08DRAFT_674396 [Tothia fuscella]
MTDYLRAPPTFFGDSTPIVEYHNIIGGPRLLWIISIVNRIVYSVNNKAFCFERFKKTISRVLAIAIASKLWNNQSVIFPEVWNLIADEGLLGLRIDIDVSKADIDVLWCWSTAVYGRAANGDLFVFVWTEGKIKPASILEKIGRRLSYLDAAVAVFGRSIIYLIRNSIILKPVPVATPAEAVVDGIAGLDAICVLIQYEGGGILDFLTVTILQSRASATRIVGSPKAKLAAAATSCGYQADAVDTQLIPVLHSKARTVVRNVGRPAVMSSSMDIRKLGSRPSTFTALHSEDILWVVGGMIRAVAS